MKMSSLINILVKRLGFLVSFNQISRKSSYESFLVIKMSSLIPILVRDGVF